MAVLDAASYPMPEPSWGGPSTEQPDHQELTRLLDASASLEPGQLTGAVLAFPVADGKAYYLVTGENPLKVVHIPFGDAWTIPAPYIRGLNEDDVRDQLEHNRRVAQLRARHK
jgi:hypothetical protein